MHFFVQKLVARSFNEVFLHSFHALLFIKIIQPPDALFAADRIFGARNKEQREFPVQPCGIFLFVESGKPLKKSRKKIIGTDIHAIRIGAVLFIVFLVHTQPGKFFAADLFIVTAEHDIVDKFRRSILPLERTADFRKHATRPNRRAVLPRTSRNDRPCVKNEP